MLAVTLPKLGYLIRRIALAREARIEIQAWATVRCAPLARWRGPGPRARRRLSIPGSPRWRGAPGRSDVVVAEDFPPVAFRHMVERLAFLPRAELGGLVMSRERHSSDACNRGRRQQPAVERRATDEQQCERGRRPEPSTGAIEARERAAHRRLTSVAPARCRRLGNCLAVLGAGAGFFFQPSFISVDVETPASGTDRTASRRSCRRTRRCPSPGASPRRRRATSPAGTRRR